MHYHGAPKWCEWWRQIILWCVFWAETDMALDNLVQSVREQMRARFYQADQAGLWQEVDRNLQAALQEVFARLDLVTREEFDRQSALLSEARVKLQGLEAALRDLEAKTKAV
jgi:BMFP domain-containing protein YqiC